MIDLDDSTQIALADRAGLQARAQDPARHWRAGLSAGAKDAALLEPTKDIDILWLALPRTLHGLGMVVSALCGNASPRVLLWQPSFASLTRRALLLDPYQTYPYQAMQAEDVGIVPTTVPMHAPPPDAHPVAVWGYLMALLGTQGSWDLGGLSDITQISTADCAVHVPVAENRAKQFAHRLYERMPVFWGQGLFAGVALDWRIRYVLYAEARAEWAELATIRQVDVMARFPRYWPQAGIYVQLAQSASLSAEVAILHQLWQARRMQHATITTRATGVLSSIYEILCLGEWTALYAAALLGVDPAERVALDFLGVNKSGA